MGHPAFDADRSTLSLDWDQRVADVFGHLERDLSSAGRDQFESEVAEAAIRMMRTGEARHLNDVLQAWYRTWLLKCNDVDDRDHEVDPSEAMTPAEVRNYLGV